MVYMYCLSLKSIIAAHQNITSYTMTDHEHVVAFIECVISVTAEELE